MGSCSVPISTLADHVQERLEETVGSPGTFWLRQAEVYTALIEACNDLLILVGRPSLTVNLPFTLQPNSVWQTLPSGLFLITDVIGPSSTLWKMSLYEMDYVQSSWGPDWENDTTDTPKRWFPIGLSRFGVHPACTTPTQILLTGIAYPTTNPWPYNGAETAPYHHEFFEALEQYAAHYCRIKETGAEMDESLSLYQGYLSLAERMTQIEDRRDPLIFSKAVGGLTGVVNIQKR